MNIRKINKILAGLKIFKTRLFKQKRPYFLGWSLTYRCPNKCKYCGVYEKEYNELRFPEIKDILDILISHGLLVVQYTGGDPVLHPDFEEIVNYSVNKGLLVNLNVSSELILKYTMILKKVNQIGVSLDGPEEINNNVRDNNTYEQVIEILKYTAKHDINSRITTVISEININYLRDVLEIAKKYKSSVLFQPVTLTKLRSKLPFESLPKKETYDDEIDKLIDFKKQGMPVYNSIPGLNILKNWPNSYPIKCTGGIVSLRLEPDGSLLACPRRYDIRKEVDNPEDVITRFKEFDNINCDTCWSANRLEVNLAYCGNISAILNMLRMNL